MTNGTILLWCVAGLYGVIIIIGAAEIVRRGLASINRRRRLSQPRVICKVRTGG